MPKYLPRSEPVFDLRIDRGLAALGSRAGISWLSIHAWLLIALLGIGSNIYVKFAAMVLVVAQAGVSRPRQHATISYTGSGSWRSAELGEQQLALDPRTRYTAAWVDLCLRLPNGTVQRLPLFADDASPEVWRALQIVLRDALGRGRTDPRRQ